MSRFLALTSPTCNHTRAAAVDAVAFDFGNNIGKNRHNHFVHRTGLALRGGVATNLSRINGSNIWGTLALPFLTATNIKSWTDAPPAWDLRRYYRVRKEPSP